MRIGQGFDAHRFTNGDSLILGGVSIPFEFGIEAHSDGDVLLHALSDALLGAVALGDIGKWFPDTDQQNKNLDSRIILRSILEEVWRSGLHVGNIDATIIAQKPRMAPYIDAMRTNIAEDCRVSLDCVSVKATTTENMGFIGRCEGIAVTAIVLLQKRR